MGRFLLFVIVVGAVALYFTNPTTEEVQAKLNGQLPTELSAVLPGAPGAPSMPAAPDMPAPPAPADMPAPPAGMPTPPAGIPAPPAGTPSVPAAPSMPGATAPGMPSLPTADMQLERKDYYLFSVYKVTVAGQTLPGCLVGIAKQVVPMTPDKCPA